MEKSQLIIESVKLFVTFCGIVIIPFIINCISIRATNSLKKRENSTKYVELALSILASENKEENIEMKEWAIKVLNHYAEIKLPENSIEQLKNISVLTQLDLDIMKMQYKKKMDDILENAAEANAKEILNNI